MNLNKFKAKMFMAMLTSLNHVTSMLSGHFKSTEKPKRSCKVCGNLTTHNKQICSP